MSNKTAILTIEFDTKSAVTNIQAAKKEIELLKNAQKAIVDEEKELLKSQKQLEMQGKQTGKEYAETKKRLEEIKNVKISEEWIKNESDIRNLNKEVRENNKILDQNSSFLQANDGSIQQLRTSLSGATARYDKLSQSERENKDIGGLLQSQIKSTSDSLKEMESETGRNQRSVGDYTNSITSAAGELGIFGSAANTVKEVQQKLIVVNKMFQAGMLTNVSALKLFRLAMISSGIGILVVALGGLVAYFTKTQEGIDFISTKMKGLTTVVGVITDKFSDVGEKIFKAFENPKQAIKDLIKLIVENLTNRVKALLVIWNGLVDRDYTKIQDGIAQMATGITDATAKTKEFAKELNDARKAGEAIEKETQRIREAERALNVERAQSKKEIKELQLLAADESKSNSERKAAIEKAREIELGQAERAKVLQAERIANIEAEQKLTKNLTADNDELAQEKIKLAELDEQSFQLQRKLQSQAQTIDKEQAARNKTREKEAEKEKQRRADLIAKDELDTAQRLENAQKVQAEQEKFAAEWREKRRIAGLDDDEERAALFELEMQKLRDQGLTEQDILLAQNDEKIRLLKVVADNEVKIIEDKEQAKRDLQQATFDASMDLMSATANLLEAVAGKSRAAFEAMKAIDTAQAIIKGLLAVQNTLATIPGPPGWVAAAAIGVTTAANVIKIQSTNPKFAEGGNIEGNSHASGGTIIEAEKGEVVINKYAVAKYWPELDKINQSTGGKAIYAPKFAMGGNVDGGLVNRNISGQVNSTMEQAAMMGQVVEKTMANLQIYTKVSDINRGQRMAAGIKADSRGR